MQDTIDDTRLHRYFDGDLSADEAERVRRALDADPALRAKLEGLREVRAVVRESVAEAFEGDLDGEDLWARIEAGLDSGAGAAAGLTTPPETAALQTATMQTGTLEKGTRATEARRQLRAIPGGAEPCPAPAAEPRGRRVAGIVVGALALAAAVLLIVLRPGEPGPADAPIAEGPGVQDDGEPEPGEPGGLDLDAIGEEVASTEVLEVDFGDNSGAIFSVEGDDGERYAVVWLADVQPKPAATE